jgi:hypothetical protein
MLYGGGNSVIELDIIVKVGVVVGVATAVFMFVVEPLLHFFSCGGGDTLKEVWINTQKHKLRVIRRVLLNDYLTCPRCGHKSLVCEEGLPISYLCHSCRYCFNNYIPVEETK